MSSSPPTPTSGEPEREGGPDHTRRRRHRRVTRPAQGGAVAGTEPDGQTSDDTDAGWGETADESAQDRWLREQRPPHWD